MDTRSAKRRICIQQWKEIIREEVLRSQETTAGLVELNLPVENNDDTHAHTIIPVPKSEASQLVEKCCMLQKK